MAASPLTGITIPKRYSDLGLPREKGGFGEGVVLLDSWLERRVFLKVIRDANAKAQLAQEVKAIVGVRSKHVVAIYEVIRDSSDAVQGIIYEYLTGDPLEPSTFLDPSLGQDFLRTIFQIACGLADIHRAGIVHRDIKLGNLKRDSEGIVKIFDFGISSGVGDVTRASRGTRLFLAPEMFSPPAKITAALDVYAFGACCWALTTRDIPKPLLELPPQSQTTIPSIRTVRPDLPTRVAEIIDRCMSVSTVKRPSSAEIVGVIEQELLRDRHHAVLRSETIKGELNSTNRTVRLRNGAAGEIRLEYDGINFRIAAVVGSIFVNNQPARSDQVLDHSCVITFGDSGQGASRDFIEVNVSHPEVVL